MYGMLLEVLLSRVSDLGGQLEIFLCLNKHVLTIGWKIK
jgi:hypothetical protein